MLGQKLRSFRKQKGLSLSELSKQTNISKSYLSYIERNVKQNPSIDVLKKIAAVMDLTVEDLIEGTISDFDREEQLLDEEWVALIQEAVREGLSKRQFQDFQEYIKYKKWSEQKKENRGEKHGEKRK